MERRRFYGTLLGALLVGLVAGASLGYYLLLPTIGERIKEVPAYPLKGDILFGMIGASVGGMEYEEPTAKIAIDEVNEYVKALGLPLTFKILIECAEGSAPKALEKLQVLYAKGVKFIFGLRWSSHAKAVLEYANEKKIILVSDGSTSPLLAIPGDYLFRLSPVDSLQGQAIARMLVDYGIKAIAVMQRGDTWGDGLYDAVKKSFEKLGGVILEYMRYDPDKTEFSAEIGVINEAVEKAIAKYGADKVGVECLSFDEVVMMQAAAADYPALMSVMWFANDGYLFSDRLLEEQAVTALKTRHIGTMYAFTKSEVYERFKAKFTPLVGYPPHVYATYLYDSIWIVAKAIIEAASVDTAVVKEIIPKVAASYWGASGLCILNEAGDRAGSDYHIWAVMSKAEIEKYELERLHTKEMDLDWAIVGIYDYMADKMRWFVPIPIPPSS